MWWRLGWSGGRGLGLTEHLVSDLYELLAIDVYDDAEFPQLRCRLDPANYDAAAEALAKAIADERIGVNQRLHGLWLSQRLSPSGAYIEDADLLILEAGLLQNLGTPDQPAAGRTPPRIGGGNDLARSRVQS